ncbi:RCC1 domain-containing protein [Desulfitobacterium sp. THU1]
MHLYKGKDTIAAGCRHTIGLKSDGTVTAVGDNNYGQCDVSGWRGITACN